MTTQSGQLSPTINVLNANQNVSINQTFGMGNEINGIARHNGQPTVSPTSRVNQNLIPQLSSMSLSMPLIYPHILSIVASNIPKQTQPLSPHILGPNQLRQSPFKNLLVSSPTAGMQPILLQPTMNLAVGQYPQIVYNNAQMMSQSLPKKRPSIKNNRSLTPTRMKFPRTRLNNGKSPKKNRRSSDRNDKRNRNSQNVETTTKNENSVCAFFLQNRCTNSHCRFSHDKSKPLTVCRFFNKIEGCRYGDKCRFSHVSDSENSSRSKKANIELLQQRS